MSDQEVKGIMESCLLEQIQDHDDGLERVDTEHLLARYIKLANDL
jgi:hypothetical protein